MNPAFWFLGAVGISLQIALLQFVVTRRLYRRTPFLALYLVILFVTGLLDLMLYLDVGGWRSSDPATQIYWIDDTLRQGALLLAVLSFMYSLGRRGKPGGLIRLLLGMTAVSLAIAGLIAYRAHSTTQLWTEAIRNISFITVLCNFVLWTRLVRHTRVEASAQSETRLLLALSAGAGIQLAGEAVGQTLRGIGFERRWDFFVISANHLLVIAHLMCLGIWLYSIWHSRAQSSEYPPGVPSL